MPTSVSAQPFCWCKIADGTCSQHGARVGESPRQVTQCGDAPAGASDTDRLTYCNTYCSSRGWRAVHCETGYNNYYQSDSTPDEANRCTPREAPAPADSGSVETPGMGDGGEDRTSPSDFGLRNPIGSTDLRVIISRLIRAVLGIVGALFLVMFVYGGVLWMTAGESKRIDSAKKTLINAVVGMIIVAFSYSMVSLVFNLAGQVAGGA
ncbi:hypothetical protein IPH19_03500 [Candidatus Uhrbacteria bacterium]|nr:MAG: hypothetical protein IPH19_03500 [Candidatus Uhrbacteria bacterium]